MSKLILRAFVQIAEDIIEPGHEVEDGVTFADVVKNAREAVRAMPEPVEPVRPATNHPYDVADAAVHAFWQAVAARYPRAEAGDFLLGDSFDKKARAAVAHWAAVNAVRFVPGDRVQLKRDVERFPHFIAKKGATGTVTSQLNGNVYVRLDEKLDGAESWNNEIAWDVEAGDWPEDDLQFYVDNDHTPRGRILLTYASYIAALNNDDHVDEQVEAAMAFLGSFDDPVIEDDPANHPDGPEAGAHAALDAALAALDGPEAEQRARARELNELNAMRISGSTPTDRAAHWNHRLVEDLPF